MQTERAKREASSPEEAREQKRPREEGDVAIMSAWSAEEHLDLSWLLDLPPEDVQVPAGLTLKRRAKESSLR